MHTQSHRHFVAVPLATLLLLLIAGVHTVLPVQGALLSRTLQETERTVIGSDDARLPFVREWHMQGLLEPKSHVAIISGSDIEWLDGEGIISAPGSIIVSLGDGQSLVLLDSSVWCRRAGRDTSVVALDAPILFRSGGTVVIIPQGFQLTIGAAIRLSPVPDDWLAARMVDAASLPAFELPDVVLSPDAALHLAHAVRSDDPLTGDDVRSLIADGMTIDSSGVLAGFIAYRMALTPGRLIDDPSADIVIDRIRSSPLASAVFDSLPLVVRSAAQPVVLKLIDSWSEFVIRKYLSDPVSGMNVLKSIRDLPELLSESGFPLQAARWHDAQDAAENTLKPLISDRDRMAFDVVQSVSLPLESSFSSSTSSLPRLAEKELLVLTRQMLVTHGVLMGASTHLLPLAGPPQGVRVVGIYIAHDGRDVPYEFTYVPETEVLTTIVRDGESEPNTVPVDVFFGME